MTTDPTPIERSRAAWRKLYEDERFAHFKTKAVLREIASIVHTETEDGAPRWDEYEGTVRRLARSAISHE